MKNIIKSNIFNSLERSLSGNDELIYVILGPRQVGKTTAILEYLNKAYNGKSKYVSADSVTGHEGWLTEVWQSARKDNDLLVIDEIQKIENWSELIKKYWDEDRREARELKVLLLGSSSLEIQKGLSESLTGRYFQVNAYHWSYNESKKLLPEMTLEDYLKYGGYPGSYKFLNNKEKFNQYVTTSIINNVIEKDILSYNNVKSPALFRQVFDMISSYPAHEISYTKLLGQLQDKGNTEKIKYYLSLYEGAFLFKSIFKYSGKQIKRKSSSPKIIPMAPVFYFQTVLDQYTDEDKGHVFEALVGAELSKLGYELFYWREGNYEVDYVLKVGRKLIAIEVKSGRRKSEKGLIKFQEQYPDAKLIFITMNNYIDFEINPKRYLEIIG